MENDNKIFNNKLERIKGFAFFANVFFIASLFMWNSEWPVGGIVFRLIWLILMYVAVSGIANIAKSSSLMTFYTLFILGIIFSNLITIPALDNPNMPLNAGIALGALSILFLICMWALMFFELAKITGVKLFRWCIYGYILCFIALSATLYMLLNSFWVTDEIRYGFGITIIIFVITQILYFISWNRINTIQEEQKSKESQAGSLN